jgi:hypothetical protein
MDNNWTNIYRLKYASRHHRICGAESTCVDGSLCIQQFCLRVSRKSVPFLLYGNMSNSRNGRAIVQHFRLINKFIASPFREHNSKHEPVECTKRKTVGPVSAIRKRSNQARPTLQVRRGHTPPHSRDRSTSDCSSEGMVPRSKPHLLPYGR